MKKKIILAVSLILALILLVSTPIQYRDGGSVGYKAALYEVTKYHQLSLDSEKGYDNGWGIEIFGIEYTIV